MSICYKWGSKNILWKNINWTWSECRIAEELAEQFRGGIDASKLYEEEYGPPWMKDPEKKKQLIRLICKVKNEKYDETKEVNKNIKITVDNIKLVIKEVLGIEISVKE
jgi:hypothetical protein